MPPDSGAQKADAEKLIQRNVPPYGFNPHPDFKAVERERPAWEESKLEFTQVKKTEWKAGDGATDSEWEKHQTIQIDPYQEGRAAVDNYKLLISAIIPRFIGFVSTVSPDGQVINLAPFSYTTVVNHDPPMFVIGFAGSKDTPKDSLKNILETKELTINVISEWFAEAANYTSINTPYNASEWTLSGLHPRPSKLVKPPVVAEAMFAIEAKLESVHEWTSPVSGKKTGCTIFARGVNFHVRDDAFIPGREGVIVDPAKLLPISRLGGISYGRTTTAFELPRPDYDTEEKKGDVKALLIDKKDSQL